MSLTETLNNLTKIYESIKKNPNRIFTHKNLDEKVIEKAKLEEFFTNLYKEKLKSNEDQNKLLQVEEVNKKFKTLCNDFDNIIEITRNKIKELKMALTTDKVLDLFSKLFPNEFNGDSEKLDQIIRILNALKETVAHAENQRQLLTLIKLRLVGKASDALTNNVDSVDGVITALKASCRGQSSRQLITSLEGTTCTDRKKYVSEIQCLAQKLMTAYVNEGVQRDSAVTYIIDDIGKNIKKNFIQNKVMVAAMNQKFNTVDEIMHRFESVQIDRDASIMHYRQNNYRNYNNGNTQNFNNNKKKRSNKQWNSNKNTQQNSNAKNQNRSMRTIKEETSENSDVPH